MTDALSRLLASRDWLLADGATATNLYNMGLPPGDPPESWNLHRPEQIRSLYQGAVDAGSDIILTNSFGGNARRLDRFGLTPQLADVNRIAASLARDVADADPRPVIVAGCIGPTGDIMAPLGQLTHAAAVAIFHQQAEALKDGGADILWLETISAAEEYAAAAEAFAAAQMPWCATMSFEVAGRTMMGLTPAEMVKKTAKLPHPPLAIGANCGIGAADHLRTMLDFTATDIALPLIAKGNAGVPKFHNGHLHYDGTPDLMADYAVLARDAGARIIGGCCGTTPDHLRAMHRALHSRPKTAAPTHDAIVAALGPFSTASPMAPRRR